MQASVSTHPVSTAVSVAPVVVTPATTAPQPTAPKAKSSPTIQAHTEAQSPEQNPTKKLYVALGTAQLWREEEEAGEEEEEAGEKVPPTCFEDQLAGEYGYVWQGI